MGESQDQRRQVAAARAVRTKKRPRRPGERVTHAPAIRDYCLRCVGYERAEVRRCTDSGCWLWPYRGRRTEIDGPERKHVTGVQRRLREPGEVATRGQAIRNFCIETHGFFGDFHQFVYLFDRHFELGRQFTESWFSSELLEEVFLSLLDAIYKFKLVNRDTNRSML